MPSKAIGAPRVTVPALPWNTANPPRQGALTLPSNAVQLVVAVFQLALPPSTASLPNVLGPSQNSSPKLLTGLMIRLTSPGVAVEISISLVRNRLGRLASTRPLSVSAPP